MITVNDYRRVGNSYVNSGNDYRLFSTNSIVYATPISAAQSNLFTVYLTDGGKFITDSAGITAFGADIVSVNEYNRSSSKLKNTGLQIKVNVNNVSTVFPSGTGYELDGTTPIDVVRVRLANSKVIITDEDGVTAIEEASQPTYRVYTALVSQSGTSNPTVTILENTIGTIAVTRNATGVYYFASSVFDGFDSNNKVSILVTNGQSTTGVYIGQYIPPISTVTLTTQNLSGIAADTLLSNATIEIRLYN